MDKSHQLPAVNLLTDAFPDAMGILVRSVRKQYIHTYLEEQLSWPPDGLCLVAMYTPDVPDRIPKIDALEDGSRLAAVITVSFSPSTREVFSRPTIQPPDEECYLCNMAVNPDYQRRGIARKLLAACEVLAKQRGKSELYLHVKVDDRIAIRLYDSYGFQPKRAFSPSQVLDLVRDGRQTRRLMVKRIDPSQTVGDPPNKAAGA